ncbi:unnamed protein product [Diatraea saccharalis]|uniref:Retinol dehydrogenase 11 n=1 Tax=Diatraea saccharalis TaxID=40085 RepID=A0A9N9RE53_9NEOP|nr:unnamed protein product [Diatraea saccharalis]
MVLLTIVLINIAVYASVVIYCKLTCGINKCSKHLVGKVVLVTGGNTGIGFETAKDLADRGAKVILGCRSVQRGTSARDKIIAETGNSDVHFRQLDLASFKSIREFADDIIKNEKQLHILINNAGMVGTSHKLTEDGLLLDMQTNHFGPFLLTSLLLPLLKSSAPSRIINVSSAAHTSGKINFDDLNKQKEAYKSFQVYSDSKLCNVLMTLELSKRLKGTGVTAYSLHPGGVSTEIFRDVWWSPLLMIVVGPIFKTSWAGAQTTNYLAVSPEVDELSGKYFADCREKPTSLLGQDEKLAEKLWHVSEKLTKLK